MCILSDYYSQTPEWLKEDLPNWIMPYVGPKGLLEKGIELESPLGKTVAGIDRWMANHWIAYRQETADYLYNSYTSKKSNYIEGVLPSYEKVRDSLLKNIIDPKEKVKCLLDYMKNNILHPTIPPCGKWAETDRALTDEQLLDVDSLWCNEQARMFVRLCQVSGLSSRMIYLFYGNKAGGHVVAEVSIDGCWSLIDSSWFIIFEKNGQLLSAADSHDGGAGQNFATEVYKKRYIELMLEAVDGFCSDGPGSRSEHQERIDTVDSQLLTFGVINYPLF